MKTAIVLLSGGIDSAVCVEIAKSWGYDVYALSFNYGQRHIKELEAASEIATITKVNSHIIINLPYIKPTIGNFFPGRNTIFLAYGLSFAESIGAECVFLGNNADDYNGFPDCRPDYINAFKEVFKLATKTKTVEILTPLIDHSKADIIGLAEFYGLDLSKTLTCYEPSENGTPCGECGACKVRLKGFSDANVTDPLIYKQ